MIKVQKIKDNFLLLKLHGIRPSALLLYSPTMISANFGDAEVASSSFVASHGENTRQEGNSKSLPFTKEQVEALVQFLFN